MKLLTRAVSTTATFTQAGRKTPTEFHKRFKSLVLLALSSGALASDEIINTVNGLAELNEISSSILEASMKSAIWNTDKTAMAICFQSKPSKCYVLRDDRPVDVSDVETVNLGKLGTASQSEYEHYETQPAKWLESSDETLQVLFTTEAWRSGQRFQASEPLIIRNGKPLSR